MIIYAKIRRSIDYTDFILLNVHPALFSASNVVQASLAAARDQKQPVAYATSCIPLCGE